MKKTETRRERARVPYEEYVVINGSLRVRAIDISEGGLYLHTGRSCPAGSIVLVEFPLSHEKLTVKAVVRFCQEGVGMGLEFRNLSTRHNELIRQYIENAFQEDETVAGAKKKVLVISDNSIGLKMYQSELTLNQFSVLQAQTAEAAEQLAKQASVDAILISLNMERPQNFRLLRSVKGSPFTSDIPLLVVSPANRAATKKNVFDAGAQVFLEKITASPQKVVQEINKLFE
jgi:CheY-like chemotaxis protein